MYLNKIQVIHLYKESKMIPLKSYLLTFIQLLMLKKVTLLCLTLVCSSSIFINAQNKTVTGKITAFNSFPIFKAEITNRKTKTTVESDSTGIFKVEAKAKDKLSIIANGFYKQSVTVNKTNDTIRINLVFRGGDKNEKIATGYGHISLDQLSYGISHLSSENETYEFYANIFDMLKSKSPGVEVSGESVRIRGISTMGGNDTPLFVVDGFPVGSQQFRNIDPQSVKSISVLKDNAASARYGARGMNGVIVVTLKKE